MELEQFKQTVTVLPTDEAQFWRRRYIDQFVNVTGEYYRQHVAKYKKFSDGLCYEGYLWDCLVKEAQVVTDRKLKRLLRKKGRVLSMWDVRSREHIFIKDYWKFPKRAVLSLEADVLLDNLQHLPEDLYLFDRVLNWTCVFTHEDNKEGRPLRLLVEGKTGISKRVS